MKKLLTVLTTALLFTSIVACNSTIEPADTTTASTTALSTPAAVTTTETPSAPTYPMEYTPVVDEPSNFTGTVNPDPWKVEEGINYTTYDFLGRGEELVSEVNAKYSSYKITYKLNKRTVREGDLSNKINLLASYDRDVSAKTLVVNIDTVDVRVRCDYTEISAASGSFIVVGFTTNIPTKFLVSIGSKGDQWGETAQDAITPTGKDGVYTAKAKLTVPYLEAGDYYLNFSVDSGNAGYPYITSIPIKITEGENSDNEFKLLYAGDWDLITAEGYQDNLTKLFYNSYPRLYARWGQGTEPKTITFVADKGYDGVAYCQGTKVVVSVDYANANPWDLGFFSHEITHSVQQYSKLNYGGDAWWTENLANYGGFRYFHWSNAQYVQVYKATDTSLQDWGYQAYGNNKWFFAYMDSRYPTSQNEDGSWNYGLIDSINLLIKNHTGAELNDDPYDTASLFNQTVKKVTGLDCIEAVRLQFVDELKNETWTFKGFGDYSDNFITENLPNTEDPVYPMATDPVHGDKTAEAIAAVTDGENLCINATIHSVSGEVNASEAGKYLIDGKGTTKWCSTGTNNPIYCLDGTVHWIIIDLGEKKSFNTYTIFNTKSAEPGYGNMVEWEVLLSDDAQNWTSVDYQPNCDKTTASFNIGDQSAQYVLLRIYQPEGTSGSTIRLYEFQLYNQ